MEKERFARVKITRIKLAGYKSIHPEGQTIDFGDITVLLGANGSGKSNLISFFKMLSFMTGGLQLFIGRQGYASTLLYFGPKHTTHISAEITFSDMENTDIYSFILSHAAGDTLIFDEEFIQWKNCRENTYHKRDLESGHKETNIISDSPHSEMMGRPFFDILEKCEVYHFLDTSSTAEIRNQVYIEDNKRIRADGGNLAAFLFALKNKEQWKPYYNRIVNFIREISPTFHDFDLSPSINEKYLLLNWRETKSDYLFGPHQLSDGSLRFMALTSLLLQPPELIPKVIVLDEPELGLHPFAISLLAGMIKTASQHSQIVLATQSPRLLDEFESHQIVVVERDERSQKSIFIRLDEHSLSEWMERYCLSEMWEKNIIGGRP